MKLLLLAIEIKATEEVSDSKISINPRGAKIQANTQGFFIAQSADEVKRYDSIDTFFDEYTKHSLESIVTGPGFTVKHATMI